MRLAMAAVVAVAGLLMLPTLIWGPAPIDSAVYNYVWTKQFGEALGQGIVYPRWLPGSFQGLGSPTFYFYPPIAFYVSGLLQLAGLTTLQAIAGAAFLAMLASGLSMAAWLKFKGANPYWALLYMAAPYHLTDWYQRAALAEFMSFAWLPLIAIAIEAQPRRWAMPLLAISFAGLFMTHLPMAVLAGVGLILPMIAFRCEHLAAYLLAGVLGLGLSAAYLLPALTLQHHVSISLMWPPYFQPATWSPWGPHDIGWIVPMAAASVALAAARSRFWFLLTLVLAAMSLALIPLIWNVPVLRQVQFPWRFLAIVEFAAVTAVATSRPRAWALALAFAIAALSWGRLIGVAFVSLQNPYPAEIDQTLPDAPEYLPAGSDLTALGPSNRPVKAQAVAPASLTDLPTPQVSWGAWISLASAALLSGLALARHLAAMRWKRRLGAD